MKVKYSKIFVKHFRKRVFSNYSLTSRFNDRLKLFFTDSKHPLLKDHPLKGKKIGLRAFSITGNIRVIYQIVNNTVYFFDIGTHNQVY
jgi:addiction module RelE/StbE family toxin